MYMCVFISLRMYNTTKKLFGLFVLTQTQCRFPVLVCRRRLRRLGREGEEGGGEGEGEGEKDVGYIYAHPRILFS